jgi:hypothetical protein
MGGEKEGRRKGEGREERQRKEEGERRNRLGTWK